MSVPNASAKEAGAEDGGIEQALRLLEEALAILDANHAPTDVRARLHEIIEALARPSG
jgi:hypothetical protein